MSLDPEFDTLVEDDHGEKLTSDETRSALIFFDAAWYINASRRARRMDLIGDYAGNELFIIDGDSLIQQVLEDPLLALGRSDDCSFQILHALRSLERLLAEFSKRNAVFEVVFWNDTKTIVSQKATDDFIFASMTLARTMLINHLARLDVPMHFFKNLSDPQWHRYRILSKPMFVMLDDGGVFDDEREEASDGDTRSILLQRTRLFDFINQGLSCTLLRGTTFQDSRIITFVYEQRLDPSARNRLPRRFWNIVKAASHSLTNLYESKRVTLAPSVQHLSPDLEPIDCFLKLGQTFVLEQGDTALSALQLFVTHLLLLPLLSVQERSRPYAPLHPKVDGYLRSAFLPTIFLIYNASYKRSPLMDVDGRVFRDLLHFILSNSHMSLRETVGDNIAVQIDQLWVKHQLPPVSFAKLASQFPPPALPNDVDSNSTSALQLLPFDNTVFSDILAEAHIAAPQAIEDVSPAEMDFNTIFHDAQHWHNHRRALLPKHLGGEDRAPALSEWQKKRQLRSEQRFTAKLQWQAESLTGAWGKALQQISIVTNPSQPSSARITQNKTATVEKPKKELKKAHVSKAEQIRLQNTARKMESRDESNETWWKEQLEKMTLLSTKGRIATTDQLLGNALRAESGWLAVDLRLYRLDLEFRAWIEDLGADSDDVEMQNTLRDKNTVTIMRMVKELCERGRLYPSARVVVESTLHCLGFATHISGLLGPCPTEKDDRKLSFGFIKLVRSKTKAPIHKFMSIVEDPIVWQLRLFGEYMDRSMDGRPDRRVTFAPDAWQRRVLDCLDDVDEKQNMNHSVLVVAPTSAGKTFISYYAMEQVLRQSDDEILVYVAPTKALVSQIAAEVYARFKKSYKSVGRSLWAIHTRDYRVHNPQNCQILVTVPEVLSIMLLSPQLSQHWIPRIKRIILDEIHSIGQQEGGAVWEQIILLAPCPIVGLSATIGEAEKFNSWLASVQEAHGFRHSFIHHPHRYSHLRKFHYNLQSKSNHVFSGTDMHIPTDRMRFLHPVSLISPGARSIPSDLSLESADCLSLYHALNSIDDRKILGLPALDPSTFFSTGQTLKQKDILMYEEALKDKLALVMDSSDPQDDASPLARLVAKLQDPIMAKLSPMEQNAVVPLDTIMGNLIFLLCDLRTNDDLPAILFSFDRSACEIAVRSLLETLEMKESKWRETSSQWRRKIQQWETWKSQAAVRAKQAERLRKQKKDPSESPAEGHTDASWESSFDPGDPSPQFSFLGYRSSKTVLNEAIEDIRWTATPKWALDALRRGIGIHHAGMNKHYRTAVESLYRMGYIQVVIATGTLALGINAPTRTSVFLGDSPFLTALMYRQCAGRAGRRGFDLLGKVVFYALPMERIQRLVMSRLPSIGGNFPLTCTMVLRLFNLLQGSNYAPVAVNAIKSLLRLPQISFIFEAGNDEMLHHVRFSIDYLRRSGLLDISGNPINLFGLAAHLYYTEPSNFALVTLMRQGIIHEVCNQADTEIAKHSFLQLMCHIFGRRPLPAVYASEKSRLRFKKSPSKVVLSPLPESAREILVQHDRETLQIFSSYAVAYCSRLVQMNGPQTSLPLSGIDYCGISDERPSTFRTYLRNTHVKVNVRSPFVANSGHDDRFNSVSELSRTCRSGLHLNEHGIPSMQKFTRSLEDDKNTLPLNAYLLDFYMHGQPAALVAANGVRLGELWYLLEDFTLTLKTIRATVEHLLLQAGRDEASSSSEEDIGSDIAVTGVNGAEMDTLDGIDGGESIVRPPGVSDRDWRVFEVVNLVTKDFEAKFKAMWA